LNDLKALESNLKVFGSDLRAFGNGLRVDEGFKSSLSGEVYIFKNA
jgi:hypothetical protein